MAFQIQTQEHDQWCWAAVSASIHGYFSGDGALSQCDIACLVLNSPCCVSPIPCNTPAFLEDALDKIGKRGDVLPRSLSFEEIMNQIDQGMPIGVRIGWFDGGGHFVVIRGYRKATGASSSVSPTLGLWTRSSIAMFHVSYLGRGEWTDTFLLKGV